LSFGSADPTGLELYADNFGAPEAIPISECSSEPVLFATAPCYTSMAPQNKGEIRYAMRQTTGSAEENRGRETPKGRPTPLDAAPGEATNASPGVLLSCQPRPPGR